MSLNKCMEETTHRQYLSWIYWLDEQWEKPSRSDNYLMSIAAEVRSVLSKNPSKIKLRHFLLKFREDNKPKLTKEQATKQSKSRWASAVGAVITVIKREKDDGGSN